MQNIHHNKFVAGGDVNITYNSANEEILWKRRLAGWLNAPDPSFTHNRLLREHHHGTGEWFLQSSEFLNWKSDLFDGSSKMLWIHGTPGNGKSVFCSTIVDHLLADPQSRSNPVLYYYFNFREDSTQSGENFLRSILSQLVHQLPSVPQYLKDFYKDHMDGAHRPSAAKLIECLISVAKTLEGVRILGDAFDECVDWDIVRDFITAVRHSDCPSLRVLFTSRPERQIKSTCQRLYIPTMNLRCKKLNNDIKKYVKEVLRSDTKFDHISTEGKALIEKVLISRADGMFRWVALQLHSLSKCRTMKSLRQALSSIPPTLDETYSRILDNLGEHDRELILRILRWLYFSMRHLRFEEVADIFRVADKTQPPFDEDDELFSPDVIMDLCSGLIIIFEQTVEVMSDFDRKLRPPIPGVKFIQLSHFSVKEYLLSPRASSWYLEESLSHKSIILSAIAFYIHFASTGIEILPYQEDEAMSYSLAGYLVRYLVQHLDSLDLREHIDIMDSFSLLLGPTMTGEQLSSITLSRHGLPPSLDEESPSDSINTTPIDLSQMPRSTVPRATESEYRAFFTAAIESVMSGYSDGHIPGNHYLAIYTAVYDYSTSSSQYNGVTSSGHASSDARGRAIRSMLIQNLTARVENIKIKTLATQNEDALHCYAVEWSQYAAGARLLDRLFGYFNSYFIRREMNEGRRYAYYVYTLALIIWSERLYLPLQRDDILLTRAAYRLMERIRDGETVDQMPLKIFIHSFVMLGCLPFKAK